MFGHDFPYLDTRDINLDWLLKNMKTLVQQWTDYQLSMNTQFSNLTEAFNELKNWIDEYFENLDVSAEIEQKLDRMALSGELGYIMRPLVSGEVADWLQEHITQPTDPVIDTSLTVAGAAADAKATGDAIQVNAESDRTFSGLLPLRWAKGGLYAETGAEYANPNERCDFVPVASGGDYIIINPNGKTFNLFEYDVLKAKTASTGLLSSTFLRLKTTAQSKYIRVMIQSDPSDVADTYGFTVIDQNGGYLVRSCGLIQSGQYASLASLPLGTVFSINTAPLNEMSDRPITNGTSGANVLTLAGNNNTRGGSMQMVFYWNGRVYYRGYNVEYQPWNELLIKGKEDGHYPVTLGYFTDNNTYAALEDLPHNTMAAFSRVAFNGMTDCPYQNETGVFVETFSPNYDTENGGIQRVTSWNGNMIAVRSFVSNEWRDWVVVENMRETVYTVGAEGTGKDFTSLVTCLKALNDKTAAPTQRYKVYIDPGTYDVSGIADLITGSAVNQAGCVLPPNTEIYGAGSDKTVVTFRYEGSNDTVMSQASPFNIPYAGKLSGMTVIVKNIRYAVHSDTNVKGLSASYMRNKVVFEDLHLIHEGFDAGLSPTYKAPAGLGMGIWEDQTRIFKNCIFEGNLYCGFLVHNQQTFAKEAFMDFESCSFISRQTGVPQFNSERSGASFISWGASAKTVVNMIGCYSNRPIALYPNASAPTGIKCDYYLTADNDLFVMESNNESAQLDDNFMTGDCIRRIATGDDITAYTPVTFLPVNTCSKDFTSAYGQGIALTSASAGDACVVQTKGLIYSPWIGLHASETGKRYNWVNGAWAETQDEDCFVYVALERVAVINPKG